MATVSYAYTMGLPRKMLPHMDPMSSARRTPSVQSYETFTTDKTGHAFTFLESKQESKKLCPFYPHAHTNSVCILRTHTHPQIVNFLIRCMLSILCTYSADFGNCIQADFQLSLHVRHIGLRSKRHTQEQILSLHVNLTMVFLVLAVTTRRYASYIYIYILYIYTHIYIYT